MAIHNDVKLKLNYYDYEYLRLYSGYFSFFLWIKNELVSVSNSCVSVHQTDATFGRESVGFAGRNSRKLDCLL